MTGFEIVTALLRGIHLSASLSVFGCFVFRAFVVPTRSMDGSATGPAGGRTAWSASRPMAQSVPATVVDAWRLARAGANRIAWFSALLALICGAAWLTAVAATIAGAEKISDIRDAVPIVALQTRFGRLVCVRLLLLAGILVVLARAGKARGPLPGLAVLCAAGVAIAIQPLLGHAGALPGMAGAVLVLIEMAHLLAAGAWLGPLLPLLVSVIRLPPAQAALLCERFTPVGLIAVGTIAMTGLPQAAESIGGIPALFGTRYGHLALLKLGLFFLALGLACANRLVFTARLNAGRAGVSHRGLARRPLIASIAVEATAGLCVVLAAAAMASSPPAAHVQPLWPFSWRPSLVAWEEPELRGELIRLVIATGVALALILAALAIRRWRIVAVVLAAVVVAPFASSSELLFVEAWPTSYMYSPTGFSVDAIATGQGLFARNCAACHDARSGTNGAADLTAAHLWEHLDGELFWWITDGIADPRKESPMPPFEFVLSEAERWALIDFIHARNIGMQAKATGHWSPPIRMPATPLSCGGGAIDSTDDLRGQLLVIVAGDEPANGPEISPEAGGTIVRLTRGRASAPRPRECVAAAPEAWDAWALLAGVAPDRFSGYQAVVDGQGWLRAWLSPEAETGQLLAVLRDAGKQPVAAPANAGHRHR
jgi:putative copper export protein/mono/diheme cytochrome c family protein